MVTPADPEIGKITLNFFSWKPRFSLLRLQNQVKVAPYSYLNESSYWQKPYSLFLRVIIILPLTMVTPADPDSG